MVPDILIKILLVSVLFVSFMLHGVFDEKIYYTTYKVPDHLKSTYNKDTFRFKESNINFLIVSILSTFISGYVLYTNKVNKVLFKTYDKFILGILYTIGKYTNENSMKYICFITKTIAKSVKSLSSIFLI